MNEGGLLTLLANKMDGFEEQLVAIVTTPTGSEL